MVAAAQPAAAADYPSRPIRIVVPTGAGGITDVLARIVADKMGQALHQSVIVDNRPGASGIVGSEYVAHAQPDGYTLLFAYPTHVVNPSLYRKLPYDTLRDFAPVTMVTTTPVVLVVAPSSPITTLRQLIEQAGKKPNALSYSSVGYGSLGSLAAELLAAQAKVKLLEVPYKGTPQATTALLSGDVSLFFDAPITIAPLVRSGKLRALGVTSAKPLAVLPDVPPIADTLPGYTALGWNGVLAPAHTPARIIDLLNHTIVGILNTPDVQQKLHEQGLDVIGDTPAQFGTAIAADIRKWGAVVRQADVPLN
jgi:tripartite-type tricarboxylate transporter receptor subunit TctC